MTHQRNSCITFDKIRWVELVKNLESKQAERNDTDWNDEENNENPDWNRSPPSSPLPFNHSSKSPPSIMNHDFSHHFEIL